MKSIRFSHCLVGIVAAMGLLLIFGVRAGSLVYLAVVLACPLMMVVLMRGMMGGAAGHSGCNHPDHQHTGSEDTHEPAERNR
jgi:hypothetical protein